MRRCIKNLYFKTWPLPLMRFLTAYFAPLNAAKEL
jgi:hypothetical protein